MKFDGVVVPTPKSYKVGMMDLSKAGRLASGDMVIETIATKVKIETEWGALTPSKLSEILTAIKPTLFEIEYYDPENGGMKTGTFYKGDRHMPIAIIKNGEPLWQGLTVNFIER